VSGLSIRNHLPIGETAKLYAKCENQRQVALTDNLPATGWRYCWLKKKRNKPVSIEADAIQNAHAILNREDYRCILFKARCSDAAVTLINGDVFLDFCRAASSFDSALESAINNVQRAGEKLWVSKLSSFRISAPLIGVDYHAATLGADREDRLHRLENRGGAELWTRCARLSWRIQPQAALQSRHRSFPGR
jgi:hypothetical protein